MKYIRTADGRIVDTEKEYQPLQWAEQARDYSLTVKEADTIKELCNCFVAVRENASGNNTNFFIDFEDWEKWINGYDIYGAIWTDKGLIYVAKLNENGELELI